MRVRNRRKREIGREEEGDWEGGREVKGREMGRKREMEVGLGDTDASEGDGRGR